MTPFIIIWPNEINWSQHSPYLLSSVVDTSPSRTRDIIRLPPSLGVITLSIVPFIRSLLYWRDPSIKRSWIATERLSNLWSGEIWEDAFARSKFSRYVVRCFLNCSALYASGVISLDHTSCYISVILRVLDQRLKFSVDHYEPVPFGTTSSLITSTKRAVQVNDVARFGN